MNGIFLFVDIAKFIFILLDIGLAVCFVIVLAKALAERPSLHPHRAAAPTLTARRAEVQDAWHKVQAKFGQGSIDSMKVAIIDADKLIDTMLKDAGFAGDSMAERLKQINPGSLSSYERLWRAHRLRNNLVHSHDFALTSGLADQAMKDFEAFLTELKYL